MQPSLCIRCQRYRIGVNIIELASAHVASDLQVYLERLVRAEAVEVRVVAREDGVSVFASTLYPAGLTDQTPLVIVHRGFSTSPRTEASFDVVVETRALLDRLPRLVDPPFELAMPPTELTAVWAGVLPPRSGWDGAGAVDSESLAKVARDGVDRVQSMLPESPGQILVDRARRDVWGLEMLPGVPAGAAFALEALGFLHDQQQVRLHRSRSWVRLSSILGDVFVRM